MATHLSQFVERWLTIREVPRSNSIGDIRFFLRR